MIGVAFGCLLLALAVLAVPTSRRLLGEYFPPATLFLTTWSATLGLFFLRLLPYPPLSGATAALLSGAVVLFLVGAVAGQRLMRGAPAVAAPSDLPNANAWVLAYCALGLLGIAWYGWLVAETLGRSAIENPFLVRRALGTRELPSLFLFLEFFCVAAPMLAVALTACGARLSRLAVVTSAVCAVATWLSTDRTQFFTLVLAAFFGFVFQRGPRLSWGRLAQATGVTALLLIINFLGVGKMMGKTPAVLGVDLRLPTRAEVSGGGTSGGGTSGGGTSGVTRLMGEGATLYLYATASYGALNSLIAQPAPRTHGVYTIYPAARALERLGVIRWPVPAYILFDRPLRLQGGSRDIQFNGYTFLVYPLLDFGVTGAIAYAALTGLLCGSAYGWAMRRRDTPLALLLIGNLSVCVILSIFVNKFNNTASWYIALATLFPLLVAELRRRRSAA
jgi:hypothetical protein